MSKLTWVKHDIGYYTSTHEDMELEVYNGVVRLYIPNGTDNSDYYTVESDSEEELFRIGEQLVFDPTFRNNNRN